MKVKPKGKAIRNCLLFCNHSQALGSALTRKIKKKILEVKEIILIIRDTLLDFNLYLRLNS